MSNGIGPRAKLRAIDTGEVFDFGQINYDIAPRAGVQVDRNGRYLVAKPADPAACRIMARVKVVPQVNGPYVLIAKFISPAKIEFKGGGSIIRPDIARMEDVYQGKVGLVLAMGETAYVDDPFRRFGGPWCRPGDWVLMPMHALAAAPFEYPTKEETMATVTDETVRVVLPAPDAAR